MRMSLSLVHEKPQLIAREHRMVFAVNLPVNLAAHT